MIRRSVPWLYTTTDRLTPVQIDFDAVILGPSAASLPTDGIRFPGQFLDLTVTFNDKVTVLTTFGTPYVPITIGSRTGQAQYSAGSGTDTLIFRYVIQAGDSDPDGVAIGPAITLNGGTIRDSQGQAAAVKLPDIPSATGIKVTSLIADFTGDGRIDFEDLMILAQAWGKQSGDPGWNQIDDSYPGSPFERADIGPTAGIVPDLVVSPDGKVNGEDLAAFTDMWDWVNQQAAAGD